MKGSLVIGRKKTPLNVPDDIEMRAEFIKSVQDVAFWYEVTALFEEMMADPEEQRRHGLDYVRQAMDEDEKRLDESVRSMREAALILEKS
ncbi:MAG: hypothetical protein WC989_05640 [Micavibrio sp.]